MKASWLVIPVVVVVALVLVGGCGGSGGQVPPGGGGVGVAAFVGRAVCGTCHAAINGEFGSYLGVPFVPGTQDASHVWANFVGSAHGQDMRSKGPGNRNVTDSVGCQPCHTVGHGEATGFTNNTDTPHLQGIGCEECHGKGSIHAGGASDSITRVPDARTTCWDCHAPDYKYLREGPPATVTNATLSASKPNAVTPNHATAALLDGHLAFDTAQTLSPHSLVENTCVTCHLHPDSLDKHGPEALEVDFQACRACHSSLVDKVAMEAYIDRYEHTASSSGRRNIVGRMIELLGEDPAVAGAPDKSARGGLLAAYATAHGIDVTTNSSPNDVYVQRYKAARHNATYIMTGGMWHNPPLVEKMLRDAKEMLLLP
jgi:hypothetical protein